MSDEHPPPAAPSYTPYHPRWHRPRVSTYWWLKRLPYVSFITRELSSVGVAWFIIFLLLLVHAVSLGKAEYEQFLAWAANPVVVAVNVVSLALVTFHAATWFNLAPQAMVVRFKGRRVPDLWIAGGNYAAWVVVSALVAWLLLSRK
jgi:fumarate reductase subunit C